MHKFGHKRLVILQPLVFRARQKSNALNFHLFKLQPEVSLTHVDFRRMGALEIVCISRLFGSIMRKAQNYNSVTLFNNPFRIRCL